MEPLISRTSTNLKSHSKVWTLVSLAVIATIAACYLVVTVNQTSHQLTLSSFNEDQALKNLFTQWKLTHGKSYSTLEEEEYRYEIFVKNYEFVQKYNSEGNTAILGLNKFSDLTQEEFKAQYASGGLTPEKEEAPIFESPYEDLPSSWDWRTKNVVTPVGDQGQCGSTWAWAPKYCLESFYAINTGKLLVFSAQQIMDCDTKDNSCSGGLSTNAFTYTAKYGIETESNYPYIGNFQNCSYNSSLAIKVNKGYKAITPKNESALQSAVYSLPTNVYVDASDNVFYQYAGGVITDGCKAAISHCLTVVGWGTFNGTDAWICKNSWGTDWGVNGYVYIAMNATANAGLGVCGILSTPLIPV